MGSKFDTALDFDDVLFKYHIDADDEFSEINYDGSQILTWLEERFTPITNVITNEQKLKNSVSGEVNF